MATLWVSLVGLAAALLATFYASDEALRWGVMVGFAAAAAAAVIEAGGAPSGPWSGARKVRLSAALSAAAAALLLLGKPEASTLQQGAVVRWWAAGLAGGWTYEAFRGAARLREPSPGGARRPPLSAGPRPGDLLALGVHAGLAVAFFCAVHESLVALVVAIVGSVLAGIAGLVMIALRAARKRSLWPAGPWSARAWFMLFPTSGVLAMGFVLTGVGVHAGHPQDVPIGLLLFGWANAMMLWGVIISVPTAEAPAAGSI